jgi:hypothetical protein
MSVCSYVNENFEWVAQVAGLGPDDLAALAVNSFEASFIPQVRGGVSKGEGGRGHVSVDAD